MMLIFKSARIKLTAWYLLIIMSITVSFSAAVYSGTVKTIERALLIHERRVENRLREFPRFENPPERFQEPINKETLDEIRNKTLALLAVINIFILVVSGGLGYLLAGRTLKPIEEMIEKQKKFIADAAHELKTPLTAIKTNLEVNLRSKKINLAQAKDIIKSTIDDVDSLTHLTNSLLRESRYQNINIGQNLEVLNLKESINKIVKKFEYKAKEKNISIKLHAENILVMADKKGIEELITILLDNAVKFNKINGNIDINLNKKDDLAYLKIKDTGVGIAQKDLPYIFDRFYKADTSRTKTEHDGFGLGLSIAKEIVEKHKGKITVISSPGKGSEFTVTLTANLVSAFSKERRLS